MRPRVALALVLHLAAALPARAAEFVPGFAADGIWDSNVLRTSEDEDADYSVRTGPDVRVRELQGDLQYDVFYQMRYEAFLETEGINGFDHFLNARGQWQITRNTQVAAANDFAYTSSLSGIFEQIPTGPDQVAVFSPFRQRITTNTSDLSVVHQIGPRWQFTARVFNQLYEYEEEFQPDSTATSGLAQFTRSMTPRLVLGAGGQIQRQEFQGVVDGADGTGTTFYQGFGVLSYAFSRTLSLSANAGPAWSVPDSAPSERAAASYIAVDPATCRRRISNVPVFDPAQRNGGCQPALYRDPSGNQVVFVTDGRPIFGVTPGDLGAPTQSLIDVPFEGELAEGALSYFGRMSLQKTWQQWMGSLSFERSASTSSGLGGSTVLTAFSGNLRWTPTRMWVFDLNAVYTTQTAANDTREQLIAMLSDPALIPAPAPGITSDPVGVPFGIISGDEIDNAIDIITYRFEILAERRITRNLRLNGRASYWKQESKGDLQSGASQEIIRVIFGFNWTFDPIPL